MDKDMALGETLAKFEFFQSGWNPYSRFLDVDKVDMVLRRTKNAQAEYREIQVKFGKLLPVAAEWEQALFDVTSWRFFEQDEFAQTRPGLYLAYVLSPDDRYRGDMFLFPAREFASLVSRAPLAGGKHRVYISRLVGNSDRWVLRRQNRFETVTAESCVDVSRYYRAFDVLEQVSL